MLPWTLLVSCLAEAGPTTSVEHFLGKTMERGYDCEYGRAGGWRSTFLGTFGAFLPGRIIDHISLDMPSGNQSDATEVLLRIRAKQGSQMDVQPRLRTGGYIIIIPSLHLPSVCLIGSC